MEVGNVAFVVGDEAFVSDDFDEVAEGAHAFFDLFFSVGRGGRVARAVDLGFVRQRGAGDQGLADEDLLKDGLDVVVLYQTPKDLPTIHREQPLQDFLVFKVEAFIVLECVDLLKVRVPIIEVVDVGIALAPVNEVDEILFETL